MANTEKFTKYPNGMLFGNQGVMLLGSVKGFNFNPSASETITYSGLTGLTFQVGDTVTGGVTSATGVVVSNSGTALVLSGITTSFQVAETITGTYGKIDYSALTGTFQIGETVTGGTSSATGVIVSNASGAMIISTITGTFTGGETITGGTSSATATADTYTAPGSATVDFVGGEGETAVFLEGGEKFGITDIVIKNATASLTTADDFGINSAINRTGTQIATISTSALALLTSSDTFISALLGASGYTLTENVVTSPEVFLSLGTPQGGAALADIDIYGYVLA